MTGHMTGQLTSEELRHARFHVHRFAEGYDIDEVDDLLDRAADTIRMYERRLKGDAR